MQQQLSIIIPTYNEEKRLAKSLPKIISFMNKTQISYEIIVVDDGSTDATMHIAKKILPKGKHQILHHKENKGKGFAVKQGMLHAKGTYSLFCDSDLSTPISEILNFWKIKDSYDIIIASRALDKSKITSRWYKRILGQVSNIFISNLVKNISDTQCGFKLFKTDISKKIFKKQTILRWGFDFEILFLAQKANYKIKELSVEWTEDLDSRVTLLDYPRTLCELYKIKSNERKGIYRETNDAKE